MPESEIGGVAALADIRERREPLCYRALLESEQQMTAKITVDTVIPRTRLKGQGTFPAGADLNDVNRVTIMSTPCEGISSSDRMSGCRTTRTRW